jgi:glycine/D-amino acid oxidase-like deaminating enzyme
MNPTTCDVLVAGGGVAGATAAVAAARHGLRTLLVEREGFLGGAGYAGMFQYLCGLYLNGQTVPAETLNDGIAREFTLRLRQLAPERSVKKIGQVFVLPYAREDLHHVLRDMCRAETTLDVRFRTLVTGVEEGGGEINSVDVAGPEGTQRIAAGVVIDATGNGAVAGMAGAVRDIAGEGERQLAGCIVRVTGLEQPIDSLSLAVPFHLAQAAREKKISPLLRFTTFTPGDVPGEGYCKLSLSGEDGAEREQRADRAAADMLECLSRTLPAFRNAVIAGRSLKVLDREGWRVSGCYTLTADDVVSARKFPDGVVRNAWPIELWHPDRGTVYRYVPRGDYYEIPLRCMMARGYSNLLTAGRCISVTHEALGSTRVMGACLALGGQAGAAAAFRLRHGRYPGSDLSGTS